MLADAPQDFALGGVQAAAITADASPPIRGPCAGPRQSGRGSSTWRSCPRIGGSPSRYGVAALGSSLVAFSPDDLGFFLAGVPEGLNFVLLGIAPFSQVQRRFIIAYQSRFPLADIFVEWVN